LPSLAESPFSLIWLPISAATPLPPDAFFRFEIRQHCRYFQAPLLRMIFRYSSPLIRRYLLLSSSFLRFPLISDISRYGAYAARPAARESCRAAPRCRGSTPSASASCACARRRRAGAAMALMAVAAQHATRVVADDEAPRERRCRASMSELRILKMMSRDEITNIAFSSSLEPPFGLFHFHADSFLSSAIFIYYSGRRFNSSGHASSTFRSSACRDYAPEITLTPCFFLSIAFTRYRRRFSLAAAGYAIMTPPLSNGRAFELLSPAHSF
jgi:hypothetical protein